MNRRVVQRVVLALAGVGMAICLLFLHVNKAKKHGFFGLGADDLCRRLISSRVFSPVDMNCLSNRTQVVGRPSEYALNGTQNCESSAGHVPGVQSKVGAVSQLGKHIDADQNKGGAVHQDRFEGCTVLDEKFDAMDNKGCYKRTRIIKTELKYPLIRVVDTFRRPNYDYASAPKAATDVTGGDVLIGQIAMAADHVTLRVKKGTARAQVEDFARAKGAVLLKRMRVPDADVYLLKLAEAKVDTVPSAVIALCHGPVSYAEPDYICHPLDTTPNDPGFSVQWNLKNNGYGKWQKDSLWMWYYNGQPGADIGTTVAWDLSTGSRNILVGVIDTGINYLHPDIADNIWINPEESGIDANGNDKRNNGIDDDGNGYVDDWHGWNFYSDNNDPIDKNAWFHGTHVAGTIGAKGNNGLLLAGVCWNVSLLPLKFLGPQGGFISDAIEAIYYATGKGVRLTNNSWGGGPPSSLLKAAIEDANAHDILFVAAAGNSSIDNDNYDEPLYPASYDCSNIIAVAATDSYDNLASFSNFGALSVDLAAPGVEILSLCYAAGEEELSGTSMAAPHVAGACALLAAGAPGWSMAQIKRRVLDCVDVLPSLAGKCVSGGRLNIGKAMLSATPLLRAENVCLSEAIGNHDGVINAGETIEVRFAVRNLWSETMTGVSTEMWCADTNISVVKGDASFGEIVGGGYSQNSEPLLFQVLSSCPRPSDIQVELRTVASTGNAWTNVVTVPVRWLSPPKMDLQVRSVDVMCFPSNPVTRTQTIGNIGDGTLRWRAEFTNVTLRKFYIPVNNSYGCAWGVTMTGNVLWVSDRDNAKLYKLDALTGVQIGVVDISSVTLHPYGLDWDGANIWVTDADVSPASVCAIAPETGQLVKKIEMPAGVIPSGVASGNGFLWVMDYAKKTVLKINPMSGQVMIAWLLPAVITARVRGLEFFDGSIWVSHVKTLYRLDQMDGSVISAFQSPALGGVDLAKDDSGRMWITDMRSNAYLVDTFPWLSMSPNSGVLNGICSQQFLLKVDPKATTAVTNRTSMKILSNDPDEPSALVTVECIVLRGKFDTYPNWWRTRGVFVSDIVRSNDFAAVNAGQVKWIALKAVEELDARLPGGAGAALHQLAASLSLSNNYVSVNHGQLKTIAQPFYDRLIAVGYTNAYPWSSSIVDDRNYALANIGQVKYLFGFEFP